MHLFPTHKTTELNNAAFLKIETYQNKTKSTPFPLLCECNRVLLTQNLFCNRCNVVKMWACLRKRFSAGTDFYSLFLDYLSNFYYLTKKKRTLCTFVCTVLVKKNLKNNQHIQNKAHIYICVCVCSCGGKQWTGNLQNLHISDNNNFKFDHGSCRNRNTVLNIKTLLI